METKNNNFKENLEEIDCEYCKNEFGIQKFKKDIWKKHLKTLRIKVVNEAKDMLKEGDIDFGKIFIFELEDEFHIQFHMDIIDKNGDIKIGEDFYMNDIREAVLKNVNMKFREK